MLAVDLHSGKRRYRPDIDGLRAVAVLLVVFNHAGMGLFPGGFIGVDVFFVISGYLIGSHMLGEMDAGRFSLGGFYERRVRRILPALLVMLLVTSVLVYVFLFPRERVAFAKTALGALFSVSNVVLSHGLGYFSPNERANPFLHTWSLGVEEQFYLVLPLLLWVLTRWGRRHLRSILWVLAVASYVVAFYWTHHDPGHAYERVVSGFYLLPFRGWELVLGVLAGAAGLPRLERQWVRDVASAAGLVLILGAGMLFGGGMPFPGWGEPAACAGAVLIILAGEGGSSATGRALGWGPVRFIGLISYSLYLWHWPIEVFQVSENVLVPDRYPGWAVKLAVVAASLVVGALSWRFVEQPFRTGVFRGSRRWLFWVSGALFAMVFGLSVAVIRSDGGSVAGLPMTAALADMQRAMPTAHEVPWDSCLVEPETFGEFQAAKCLADDPRRPHVLLLGDSHAGAMYWGLKNVYPELNISLFGVTRCTPTLVARNDLCQRYSDAIFKGYLPRHHVDMVILMSRWVQWDVDAHIAGTVDWLRQRGIKTVIFGPTTEYDQPLVRLIELSEREHDAALPGRHSVAEAKQLDEQMRALAREQWHVPYVSMYDDLCRPALVQGGLNADGCPVFAAPGVALLWDTDHLSPTGSLYFARVVRADGQVPVVGR